MADKPENKQSGGAGTNRLMPVLLVALAVVAALGMGGLWFYQNNPAAEAAAAAKLPEVMALGADDAPVEMIEYASMTCSFCAAFHSGTLPQLKEDYIDTGQVRLVFREFPLDARATAAALLARCAAKEGGQKRFFGFIQTLFDRQTGWVLAQDGYVALQNIARQGGFSNDSFAACMEDRDLLEKLHHQVQQGKEQFQINSTPTFFINGVRVEGNQPYHHLREVIDAQLERAG